MEIDGFSFGSILIDGKAYNTDLIIFPDGTIIENWRRQQGHLLISSDISILLDTAPETLVIGTGARGLMTVLDSLLKECQTRGMEVYVMPTGDAVNKYNESLNTGERIGACFHLTC